ncbi:MAG: anthranilate phosphoribosyltransferase [Prevotella sp.]|nr:anthranilate phosphoribosyltransferase [Prevotella sp.]MDY3248249.1 anthranilate phosphoribosyltransferase [Prevotella sp.]
MEMKDILGKILNQERLTREETREILIGITREAYPQEQITALLTAIQMRGVTVDELLGFRDGILETGVPAQLDCPCYIDVVGTGGDRKNTFNISTTSCFVIAGAGYKVAKHGNYAATSVSGASNVIAQHGVRFTSDMDTLNRSINEAGIVYLHAQLFAKAMKFVAPIRHALQFPTVFNLLGPLVNPAHPKAQLLGVANLDQMRLYAQVYQRLGIDYGIINSIDGYDEISLTGDFKVATNQYERIFRPADLGMQPARPEELQAGATEAEAAAIFDSVLNNTCLPAQKNIVVANAAFGIQVMEHGQKPIDECVAIARESIDSGAALRTFNKFVEINS